MTEVDEDDNGLRAVDPTSLLGDADQFNDVKGYPAGNPSFFEGEKEQRLKDEADHGKGEAWKRAWQRKVERGGAKAKASPKTASGFAFGADGKPQAPPKPSRMGGKSQDISGIVTSVQLAHAMIAMKLENSDFMLTDDEAYMITKAVVDLLDHYKIKLSGKASAWSSLIMAITMVYGPRVGTLVIDKMKVNKQAPPTNGANVHNFPNVS